jgi:hypothetical protein
MAAIEMPSLTSSVTERRGHRLTPSSWLKRVACIGRDLAGQDQLGNILLDLDV